MSDIAMQLRNMLLEHAPCEWLDRAQDYFSKLEAQLAQAEAKLKEWQAECVKIDKERDQLKAELELVHKNHDEWVKNRERQSGEKINAWRTEAERLAGMLKLYEQIISHADNNVGVFAARQALADHEAFKEKMK